MDRILSVTPSGMAAATELTVASLVNPTELNSLGLAVPDWRVCRTVGAGTDDATWYRLDASSAGVSAPYVMASATAGLRWVAIAGRYINSAVAINGALTLPTTPLAASSGGTGQASYVVGDVLFASGVAALSALADVAVGNSLISGGVGIAPAWGKIALTTHVSGILPSANGGTGINNAGSITNASNTIITGGGTVALGGFTLTVPATGTAALLATANVFTAVQKINAGAATFIARNATNTSYADVRVYNDQDSGSRMLGLAYAGSAYASAFLSGTNSPVGEQAVVFTAGAHPLIFGTNNVYRAQIDASGTFWVDNATLAAVFRQSVTTGYVSQRWYNDQNSAVRALEQGYSGSAYASAILTGGIVGESGYIATTGNYPLQIGTNNTARLTITGAGVVTFSNTTSASTSLLGAVVVGNGTAATSVALGAGNINAGGNVLSSRAAIGNVGVSSLASLVVANGALTGTAQIGIFLSDFAGTSAATVALRGAQMSISTAAAAHTCAEATVFVIGAVVAGAGSTITRAYSMRTNQQNAGATSNIGISNASALTETGNWFIYDNGTYDSRFGGGITIASGTASTSTTTGALIVAGGVGVAGQITFNGNTGLSLRVTNATANAAVATTLGSVGPTGSTAGNPQGWLRISVAGTDRYIPFW